MGEFIPASTFDSVPYKVNHSKPYGPWIRIDLSQAPFIATVDRSFNTPSGFPLFHTEYCTSTMDLAWLLNKRNEFPEWSSVLSDQQQSGRGQFGRTWTSEFGNLYASIRLHNTPSHSFMSSFLPALAVSKVLTNLGIHSEFKWPNDILISHKKVGGILVEERSGVVIAGIGLNLTSSPSRKDLSTPESIPAGHLGEWGLFLTPFDLWQNIQQKILEFAGNCAQSLKATDLVKRLEEILAYSGEPVVFRTSDGYEFQAVVSGLSDDGGIRLKTVDGEKTFFSGSLFPVIH
jgi:BirA family biotin operon repressor/biotin-[acetyl-CoA-carboxylase] ligase